MDDTLFLISEDDGDRLEVGTVDDIVDAVGGETYVIEYDDKQRTQPWLQTDDNVLEIDVREAMMTLPHTGETVAELIDYDMSTDRYGLPTRTYNFANQLVDILERQGSS
ncbi:hypothetical protein [Haloferax sp. Atlit-4N]|uniref:hypothetical protein n=1 Tax=Haloferax sp. Atlit-4N TaxID=2077206 RepID=UPI001F1CC4A4|nr:hypothetical protein [Haloferax sp. Atlit-4N]